MKLICVQPVLAIAVAKYNTTTTTNSPPFFLPVCTVQLLYTTRLISSGDCSTHFSEDFALLNIIVLFIYGKSELSLILIFPDFLF